MIRVHLKSGFAVEFSDRDGWVLSAERTDGWICVAFEEKPSKPRKKGWKPDTETVAWLPEDNVLWLEYS